MPREFRKRGRHGNKRQKFSKAQDDQSFDPSSSSHSTQQATRHQDVLQIALEGGSDPNLRSGEEFDQETNLDPVQFPTVTPDLRAYWREIDEKLQEFERLGVGSYHARPKQNDEDEAEDEDERQLLLRSALTELNGQELALASDPDTSIILERILHSMDGFAIRVLADRLIERFVDLCAHRHASHVIQTLLTLSAPVLDQEARTDKLGGKGKLQEQDDSLPSMTDLLCQACEDILPRLDSLASSPSSCHVLVVLLLLCYGKPITEEIYRSRKSSQWRSKQGPIRSVFQSQTSKNENSQSSTHPTTPRKVPSKLKRKANGLYSQMKKNWGHQNTFGSVRSVATNPSMAALLQLLIELEFDKAEAETAGSLTDIILDGLFQTESSSRRSEFVEVCLRDVTASRVIERILSRLSPDAFNRFHNVYLTGRIGHFCNHPVTNFIIAKAVSQFNRENFLSALEECRPKLTDCIDNYRIGFFKSLIETSVTFGEGVQKEAIDTILKAFGIREGSDYRYIFPCLISLTRLEYFRKTAAFNLISSSTPISRDQVRLPESNVQGSLLLQAMLQNSSPALNKIISQAINDMPLEIILAFSRDPISSRALDSLFKSSTINPAIRRQFTLRFIGRFHELADDRIGSHVAEACWNGSDVYLKEKIATSLVDRQLVLQKSSFGHFFLKKLSLPLFERQRDSWKKKMAAQALQR